MRSAAAPGRCRPRCGVFAGALAALALAAALAGCGREAGPAAALTVWAHAGQAAERRVLEAQVARWNAAHPQARVALTLLPEGAYGSQVQAAALAGDLPDVLELDGPYVARYAWQGHLRPLDGLLPRAVVEDLIPSVRAQGTWRGRLYAVGAFDSGLALWARRSLVEAAGARIPAHPREAWSAREFEALLAALAARDPDGAVLDLKLNWQGEWYTYGFSPLLVSAGGDLIDRSRWRAAGTLDGSASVAAMRTVQGWIRRGYVDPNLDDAAFVQGRVALSWSGHWDWPRYRAAWGEDLVLVPLPDLGRGSRSGQGSWAWGVTARARDPRLAARFLAFLLRPEEVLAMTAANGAVPGTRTALARSPAHAPGGPLHLYAVQLTQGWTVPRPRTPAYPVVTSAFQQAFADIRDGVDPRAALARAARLIDEDIAANAGYR